jgi:glucose-6-phosphate dehydrogenase assembly protein OpcA
VTLDLQAILDELAERNRTAPTMHVATMTLVVYFQDETVGALARARIRSLAAKHPARVLVLDAARGDGLQIIEKAGSETRGDWIELGVAGSTPAEVRATVDTLAMREAPNALIWASRSVAGDPNFAALSEGAQAVVVNSSLIDASDAPLRELIAYVEAHPNDPIADMAYLRLAPWQEAIAQFFDAKDVIDQLFDLRRVEIRCGSDAEAVYMLGWLASRLGWKPCAADAFCNRIGTTIVFSIVRDGELRRVRRISLASSTNEFVAQIGGGDTPAIALSAGGDRDWQQRWQPINDIDAASLVERAILTGTGDRVFRESLEAAAQLLARRKSDDG